MRTILFGRLIDVKALHPSKALYETMFPSTPLPPVRVIVSINF